MIAFIASLYLITAIVSVAAGSMQAVRLVKLGHSSEMSISTWALWFVAQLITFMYFLTIAQLFPIIVSSLWTLLYAVILGLVLYYRKYPRRDVVLDLVEVQ